jgi:hypothetical protein
VEERQIRKIRAAVAQAALDLAAQMMEIDACLAHALLEEPSQMPLGQRNVEKRQQRLGDSVGDWPETLAESGREKEGLHERQA